MADLLSRNNGMVAWLSLWFICSTEKSKRPLFRMLNFPPNVLIVLMIKFQ